MKDMKDIIKSILIIIAVIIFFIILSPLILFFFIILSAYWVAANLHEKAWSAIHNVL